MSKGQELMRDLMGELIYEREECVEIPTLLAELAIRFRNYPDEDKHEIKKALLGEGNLG